MKRVATLGDELDRIGSIGEDEFKLLCKRANLLCSEIYPDRTGKDFVVEFRLSNDIDLIPIDKRLPPTQVIVQVKTILATRDTAKVSLSVAERLAKDPRPAIIAILRINERDEIVDLHFVHLINEQLGRVLKALRQASTKKQVRLHKREVTFRTKGAECIERQPPDFYAAVASLAGGGMFAYATKKSHQLDQLGFEADRYGMKFSISSSPDDMADGFLGIKPLEISDVIITERRFSIDMPLGSVSKTTIEFLPTSDLKGTTFIRSFADGTPQEVQLSSEYVVVPEILMGTGHSAFRALTPYGEIVVKAQNWTFRQSPDFGVGTRHTLQEWIVFLELGVIFGHANFSVLFTNDLEAPPLQFDVSEPEAMFDTKRERLLLALLDLYRPIAKEMNLETETFTLSELWRQRKAIELISLTMKEVTARFQCRGSEPASPGVFGLRGALVCPVSLLGCWIGIFLPIDISTETDGADTIWNGKQTRKAVLERLRADDIEGSFESFRSKYCDLTDVSLAFVQQPGEFMLGDTMLMDLRSKAG